jgi:histidine triad (HIT) family protein
MDGCIFCGIANGQIPSHKIWENEDFLAILDIFPNSQGQALLLPKQHCGSDPALTPADIWQKAMAASQEIMQKLKRALGVYRVALVVEGMGVDHLHVKFYPLHGLDATWRPHIPKTRIIMDSYPGYITTHLGPAANQQELAGLAEQIRKA